MLAPDAPAAAGVQQEDARPACELFIIGKCVYTRSECLYSHREGLLRLSYPPANGAWKGGPLAPIQWRANKDAAEMREWIAMRENGADAAAEFNNAPAEDVEFNAENGLPKKEGGEEGDGGRSDKDGCVRVGAAIGVAGIAAGVAALVVHLAHEKAKADERKTRDESYRANSFSGNSNNNGGDNNIAD